MAGDPRFAAMPKTLKSYPQATSAMFHIGHASGPGIPSSHHSPFQRHEKLAVLCMDAIASWSQAETFLLRAVVHLLGGSQAPDALAYLRSGRQSEREGMIAEKGLSNLPGFDLTLFNRIRSKLAEHGHERNDLAHGFWGDSSALPDALLWIDSEDVPLEFHPRGLGDFNNNIRGWADKVRVYKAVDFRRMTKNNVLDASLLAHFHAMRVGYDGDWHRNRLVAALART